MDPHVKRPLPEYTSPYLRILNALGAMRTTLSDHGHTVEYRPSTPDSPTDRPFQLWRLASRELVGDFRDLAGLERAVEELLSVKASERTPLPKTRYGAIPPLSSFLDNKARFHVAGYPPRALANRHDAYRNGSHGHVQLAGSKG